MLNEGTEGENMAHFPLGRLRTTCKYGNTEASARRVYPNRCFECKGISLIM